MLPNCPIFSIRVKLRILICSFKIISHTTRLVQHQHNIARSAFCRSSHFASSIRFQLNGIPRISCVLYIFRNGLAHDQTITSRHFFVAQRCVSHRTHRSCSHSTAGIIKRHQTCRICHADSRTMGDSFRNNLRILAEHDFFHIGLIGSLLRFAQFFPSSVICFIIQGVHVVIKLFSQQFAYIYRISCGRLRLRLVLLVAVLGVGIVLCGIIRFRFFLFLLLVRFFFQDGLFFRLGGFFLRLHLTGRCARFGLVLLLYFFRPGCVRLLLRRHGEAKTAHHRHDKCQCQQECQRFPYFISHKHSPFHPFLSVSQTTCGKRRWVWRFCTLSIYQTSCTKASNF